MSRPHTGRSEESSNGEGDLTGTKGPASASKARVREIAYQRLTPRERPRGLCPGKHRLRTQSRAMFQMELWGHCFGSLPRWKQCPKRQEKGSFHRGDEGGCSQDIVSAWALQGEQNWKGSRQRKQCEQEAEAEKRKVN